MIQVVFVDANANDKIYNQIAMSIIPRVGEIVDMKFQDVTSTTITQAHITGRVKSVVWKNQYSVQIVIGS